jgi:dynein heavy chain, axonemal
MDAKESRKTIKAYNRLAQTLLEFEVLWHTAWAKGTDAILALLQGPVLVAHPTTGQLHVNLNSSVLSMLQEARWMGRIGLPLPDSVRRALLTSDALQRRHTRLSAAVSCLIKEHATLPAELKPLMAPVMKHVNKRAEVGGHACIH